MNRRYTGIIIGLFAIAALEFGLLGADAAGITGGGGGVPPVIERGVIETPVPPTFTATATATPFQTPFPLTPVSPPQADITGAFLQADPLTIRCDGSQNSLVTVRLIQSNGDPAPDSTPVYFLAYNGGVKPPYGNTTTDGYVTVSVWFYSDIFPQGPNLTVRSGLFEAGIRIRCLPISGGLCPISVPSTTSPPCPLTPTPTPASPPTCNPSPGSGPMSPPCPTEPACSISPPSASPPCVTPTPECPLSPPSASPPCTTPPLQSDLVMAIDCDTGVTGIQDSCAISNVGGKYDVDVYLTNNGFSPLPVAAFNSTVGDPDISRLVPKPGAFYGLNENPDFQAVPEPNAWECFPVIPDGSTDYEGARRSLISCVDYGLNSPALLIPGSPHRMFTVHYTVPAAAQPGEVFLTLLDSDVFDPLVTGLGSCQIIEPVMECRGATVHITDDATIPGPPQNTLTPTPGIATCISIPDGLCDTPTSSPIPTSTRTATPTLSPVPTSTHTPIPTSTPLPTKTPARTATAPARTATVPARTTTPAPEPAKKPKRRCADVNGDGRVSFRDVRLITRQIARDLYDERYDINGDGRVTNSDAIRAIRQLGRRC